MASHILDQESFNQLLRQGLLRLDRIRGVWVVGGHQSTAWVRDPRDWGHHALLPGDWVAIAAPEDADIVRIDPEWRAWATALQTGTIAPRSHDTWQALIECSFSPELANGTEIRVRPNTILRTGGLTVTQIAVRREAQLRRRHGELAPRPEQYSTWQAFEDVLASHQDRLANQLIQIPVDSSEPTDDSPQWLDIFVDAERAARDAAFSEQLTGEWEQSQQNLEQLMVGQKVLDPETPPPKRSRYELLLDDWP